MLIYQRVIQLGLSENWGYLQIAILRAKWNGWFISGFWESLDVQSMPCGHTWLKWNWTYAPNLGTSYKYMTGPFPSFGFMADHPNEEWTRTRKSRIVIKVYIIHHYLVERMETLVVWSDQPCPANTTIKPTFYISGKNSIGHRQHFRPSLKPPVLFVIPLPYMTHTPTISIPCLTENLTRSPGISSWPDAAVPCPTCSSKGSIPFCKFSKPQAEPSQSHSLVVAMSKKHSMTYQQHPAISQIDTHTHTPKNK